MSDGCLVCREEWNSRTLSRSEGICPICEKNGWRRKNPTAKEVASGKVWWWRITKDYYGKYGEPLPASMSINVLDDVFFKYHTADNCDLYWKHVTYTNDDIWCEIVIPV